ncbi:MAG: S41 family peptidase [Negativicutes bacterium]|nr:S41 family peptidase [Negativicutes bacterium]
MPNINWQADLDQLATELPMLHKNLFFHQEKDQFNASITTLKNHVEDMDIYTIVMEIARIVAAIGDAHTSVTLPRYNRLPFECYWFQEGIFITATLPEGKDLLHHKIVSIDGMPIDHVVERLSSIVSHENQGFLMSQLPDFLICADILFGLTISHHNKSVKIMLENQDNQQREVTLATIKYEDWQSAILQVQDEGYGELPLYRRNSEKYFWSEFDPTQKLLYINYNNCKDMPTATIREFSRQLIKEIKSNAEIKSMVIDLRNNGGGNSELFKGFLKWLSTFGRLNRQGSLFVIVGRDTFSSALLNTYYLKFHTQAVFLGEPTGGKPNHYGEVKYLSLNSSGLYIRYSTKYYEHVDDDNLPSFMPDVSFAISFADYRQHIDPCIDWIYRKIG